MNLTPEQKAIGKENFQAAIGSELTRREFLQGSLAAGMVSGGAGLGAYYFGYDKRLNNPVRVGVIGTGDEGGVLMGAHNPEFVNIVAIADIRPYSIHRAFHGDQSSENAYRARPGLMQKYGWTTEDEARRHVKVYDKDYRDLLKDPDIEAVIIALPLHLHAPVAIEALEHGKHVLTEKLMAHSVHQCKDMARVARRTGLHLATGHQRHYSILYDNAVQTIRWGLIGRIHHIRAQWHRGNLPGHDSWQQPLPDEKMKNTLERYRRELETATGARRDAVAKRVRILEAQYADAAIDAAAHGYQSYTLPTDPISGTAHQVTPLEELIRWRLFLRTGGGLMAELGSHQLDAASIFISAMREDGKKVHPLSVSAVGGRHLFPVDREVEDHVYCAFEFPAPDYDRDPEKKVVVTYSSINGNGFGGYGEVVMGTKGTLILERERDVMIFPSGSASTKVKVSKKEDELVLDTSASGDPAAAAVGSAATAGPVSRGYTEEIEHWAWCIRNPDPANRPKCHPEVALADAIIALTSNIAIREKRRVDFKPEWFNIDSDETPEGVPPSQPA